jgi:NADPH-dependent 2,4-dienoyl-CoA reductase/sulfur reductase-like enzyme
MQHYQYLIIGGGMTADAAIRGIREVDADGTIGLISAEPNPPYDRPPLTKDLWQDTSLDEIWRDTEGLSVDMVLGKVAQPLDAGQKRVLVQTPEEQQGESTDNREMVFSYDKLLLATGGTPRRLPFDDNQIIYFRTVQDYQRLRALTEKKQRFAVIGGGFIGSEVAAALAINDKKVTMIFPEPGIGGLTFPADLALFLNDYYRERGVDVLAGEIVSGVDEKENGELTLEMKSGQTVTVEAIVAGIGIDPNVTLAQRAGLEVDNGILVDEFLRTSDPSIYAAGDVANFYNPVLEKRIRVEHENNANEMGRMAGRSMAGEPEPYNYLPFFYSDLFDLGYEAIGELNPELDTVANWKEPFREGIVYYLDQGRVKGIILWNVWGMLDAARQLLAEPKLFKPEDLQERLSEAG